MGVGQLQGTPWHEEYLKMDEDDTRRHRSRCKYYDKTTRHCGVFGDGCHGATNCSYYKEKENTEDKTNERPTPSPKKQSMLSWADARVGDPVRSTRFGDGVIVRLEGKKVTVRFEDGTTREFNR